MQRREITCCFTGHRPSKLPWGGNEQDPRCLALKRVLRDRIEEAYQEGYRHFICGMALGCDFYFCEAALALREERYPDLEVEAAVPYPGQADRWSAEHRARYRALLDRCSWETVVQRQYDPGCMMRRNRYMADRSSLVLAVFNGTAGGTMNTLVYAAKQKIRTRIIDLGPFAELDEPK